MGSVMEIIECPCCGGEAHMDFYYKSGEEYINCRECGYHRSFIIKNLESQGEEGWKPDFNLEEHDGCGAYEIRWKGAIHYECGGFVSEESEPEFIALVEGRKDELEHAQYTKLVDGKWTKIILIQGKEPEVQGNEDEVTTPSES